MPFPTFKTADEIPEAFRDSYVEKDGEWSIPEPEAKPLGDGGKKAIAAEREARQKAEDTLKALEAEAADLRQKAAAQKAGITDEQLTKLRDEVRTDLEKEYAGLKTEVETLRADNTDLRLVSVVKAEAAANGVRADRLDRWWKQFGDEFKLTDDGKPMVKDSPGITVASHITELKKELGEFYVGSQLEGGGSNGSKPGKPTEGISVEDLMKNPTQALTVAREGEAA